jgi:Secretion system C-terminal sorting domain
MKKMVILLFFLFNLNSSFSQITIDSFTVYNTGTILDSFNVKIQSNGQLFSEILWSKTFDGCGTIKWFAYFIGCETGPPVYIDTTFIHGFTTTLVKVYAIWDTSSSCSNPLQQTTMDLKIWDICNNNGLSEKQSLDINISLTPNPANNFITISKPEELEIIEIQAFSSNGKRIPLEAKLKDAIDVSSWAEGVYFIQITTDFGTVRKKIFKN